MLNYFFDLYKKTGGDCRDLDSLLKSLPWKKIETKPDGTEIYVCEIEESS